MSFNVALTGLNAANQDLSVTANNLANVSTVGFKGSRAEFADLFAATQTGVSSTAVGNGVAVSEVAQQFSQGDIETTGNNLDLAISGNGFFTTTNNGALEFTRDGEFQVNCARPRRHRKRRHLQVYPPLADGTFNTGGHARSARLSRPRASRRRRPPPPSPRTCRPTRPPPRIAVFSPTDPNSYNNTTSLTVYDSLGAAHTASLYFTKTATANNWTAQLYVDGNAVGTAGTGLQLQRRTDHAATVSRLPSYTRRPVPGAMNMTFNFNRRRSTATTSASRPCSRTATPPAC